MSRCLEHPGSKCDLQLDCPQKSATSVAFKAKRSMDGSASRRGNASIAPQPRMLSTWKAFGKSLKIQGTNVSMFMVQYHFCKCVLWILKRTRLRQAARYSLLSTRKVCLQGGGILCSREALSLRRRIKSLSHSKRCCHTGTGTRELSSAYSAAPIYLARSEAPSELLLIRQPFMQITVPYSLE